MRLSSRVGKGKGEGSLFFEKGDILSDLGCFFLFFSFSFCTK